MKILEISIKDSYLEKMKIFDLRTGSDGFVNQFLDSQPKLSGETPTHKFDYILRNTGIGVGNYFSEEVSHDKPKRQSRMY